MSEAPSQLTIEAARHGGYIVIGRSNYGERDRPLFAGSLPDALDFMRSQFSGIMKPPTPGVIDVVREGLQAKRPVDKMTSTPGDWRSE